MGMKLFINTPDLRSTVVEMSDGSLLEVRRGEETFRRKKQSERRIFANRAEWLCLVDGAKADVKTEGVTATTVDTNTDWAKMKKIYADYGIRCNLTASSTLCKKLEQLQKYLAYTTKYYGNYSSSSNVTKYTQQIDELTKQIEQQGADYIEHYSHRYGRPSEVQVATADGRRINFYLARDGLMEFDGKRGRTFAELGFSESNAVWVCCKKTGWNSEEAVQPY